MIEWLFFVTLIALAVERLFQAILDSVYHIWYTIFATVKPKQLDPVSALGSKQGKRVPAIFFRTDAGGEPVRDWLKTLTSDDRKRIGEDIKTVEFGWPIGMPVCKFLGNGLCEVRSKLERNRIARVLFYIDKKGRMVLLHGFVKKTQNTPSEDLDLATGNMRRHQGGLQ